MWPAQPQSTIGAADLLEPQDRLGFERLLQWLRLTFLLSPFLVLIAYGPAAIAQAALIAAATIGSYAWVWLLANQRPKTLLRFQLGLRLVDCTLVYLVLINLHAFLRNAYYDSVYILFVVAAAATHRRRGVLLLASAAGAAVLAGRLQLVAAGVLAFEPRHVTDSVFYALFFGVTGLSVAFLMHKSGEVVERRESVWRAQLADRNAALERTAAQLAAANRDLDRALSDLKVTTHQQEEFLAGISHDLKNPLSVIIGRAQALQRGAASGAQDPQRLGESLTAIEAAGTQMVGLIDELLDLARLHTGRPLELDCHPTDLVALARAAVAQHAQAAGRHEMYLDAAVPGIVGLWDAARLERVLANLLSNAMKYSPQGSEIRVGVTREDGDDGSWAVLRVQDQGVGIPAADLPHIFERFHRARNVAGRIGGTGLGLASARQIVDSHGGSITVQSAEGVATTFTMRLPLGSPAPTERR